MPETIDPQPKPIRNRLGGYLSAGATTEERNAEMRRRAQMRHSLDAYIKAIVKRAPELTPEQIQRLRDLLPPVEAPAADAVTPAA